MTALADAKAFFDGKPRKFREMVGAWLDEVEGLYPQSFSDGMLKRWLSTASAAGHKSAFRELGADNERFKRSGLAMSSDDEAIRAKAKDVANACVLLRSKADVYEQSNKSIYDVLARFTLDKGVEPPEVKGNKTHLGAVNRMCCHRWWRRRLRSGHKRWVEACAIDFGSVRKGRGLYVSDDCLMSRINQNENNKSTLSQLVAFCDETEIEVAMGDIINSSLSNPKNLFSETMQRMAGLQQFAKENEHKCHFWTLTAPSRFHRCASSAAGNVFDNPKWEGATPRDTQTYLNSVWARIRAKLNREGITVYGIRVAEPHHDATPHWHFMIFGNGKDLNRAAHWARHYALLDCPDETGAKKRRFTVKNIIEKTRTFIDEETGEQRTVTYSPMSYLAKYLGKNLTSSGSASYSASASDEDGASRIDAAVARVDAWKACWGIRQFQFLDSHRVTVWRELRRIKLDALDVEKAETKEARELANSLARFRPFLEAVHRRDETSASWFDYMKLMDSQPLALATELGTQDTGYGDPVGDVVIGLVFTDTGELAETRRLKWVIKQHSQNDAPWSSFNNCTEKKKQVSRSDKKSPNDDGGQKREVT